MIREILQQLTFGHRMVLYRLLIALFLAGMIYYAFFFPKEGDRALRRAAEAMRHAQSWKVESNQDLPQIQGRLHILQEVACPSNSRSTTQQSQLVDGVAREWTNVNMTIGPNSYAYTSAADKWTQSSSYGGGPKATCEAMSRGEPPPPLPPLSKWARTAFAAKGDRRDIGTGYCRDWKITIPRHNVDPERASVCIGEDDELPRYVTQYGHEVRIFDWNVPIDFQPPQIDPKP
jgi:hypothetical protein